MGCGVRPPNGDKYCNSCGSEVSPLAEMCVKCGAKLGAKVQTHKSKTAAVLLAVFLAPWTWVYTYRKDAGKFWAGLALLLACILGLFVGNHPSVTGYLVIQMISLIVPIGVWLWAIIDVSIKKSEWYNSY